MDGEDNGEPYEQMDDLGIWVVSHIFGNTHIYVFFEKSEKSYSTVSGLACLPKNMVPMRLILANGSTY